MYDLKARCIMRRLTNTILLISLVFPLVVFGESFTGKVVAVTDGDTIQVMRNGSAAKVRFWGVDAPERNQAFGTKAKQFVSEKCFNKEVRVDIKDVDQYGRLVGEIFLSSGERLNSLVVKEGMAWWYKRYAPNDSEFGRLQFNAMDKKKGLWSDSAVPIAPWDFRRKGNTTQSPTSTASPRKPQSSTTTQTQSITVYITKSGKNYHNTGCRYLSKSKISSDLISAKQSYGPCSVCKPLR